MLPPWPRLRGSAAPEEKARTDRECRAVTRRGARSYPNLHEANCASLGRPFHLPPPLGCRGDQRAAALRHAVLVLVPTSSCR